MTEIPGSAGSTARPAAKDGLLADVARSEAAERLKAEAQEYLAVQAQRLLVGVGRKLGEATVRLEDVAEGRSPGFARLALDVGRKLAEGKGPVRTAMELGASRAKDGVTGALKNLGGRGKREGGTGGKPTVIVEHIDVGVPVRTAYDRWARYEDSWQAEITEQVPGDRIFWRSEGAGGSTRGVVSFHRLADDLTRVLLVVEYRPQGLFEKTGSLWRARGRRARLDLKDFARHLTLEGEARDGRRGEIRDGEAVRAHEDTVTREDRDGSAQARQDREETASGRVAGDEPDRYEEEERHESEEKPLHAEEEAPYGEEGAAYEEEEPEEQPEEAEEAVYEDDAYAYDDAGADADRIEGGDTYAYRDEDAYADQGSRR
ncbi:SRPBCC family protein [Streptomyces leeuwenhoekii]|uniref:SRPBCC family protein n=1 Tax=Streptomyces leeuwenhoekii TaxID=1437453 RepID=UPI0036F76E1B